MMKRTVKSAAALLCVLLLLASPLCGMLPIHAKEEEPAIAASDWMASISDDAYLNSVNIPGTHDSGMYYSSAWTDEYAITQKTDIAGQLEAGARIFDIRLRYGGNNKAVLCHGQGSAFRYDAEIPAKTEDEDDRLYTYDIVLSQIAAFLNAHPGETVILTVQHEYKADDEDEDEDAAGNAQNTATAVKKAEEEFAAALNVNENPIYHFKKAERYNVRLKMSEVRGRAVIFEYSETDGMGFGDLMPSSRNNYEFTFAEKWLVLLPFFRSAPDQNITTFKEKAAFRAAYTSSTGQKAYNRDGKVIHNNVGIIGTDLIVPTPDKEGKNMRKLLLSYPFEKGAYYGWISMDFLDEDLARTIFETNLFKDDPVKRQKAPTTYISDIRGFLDCDYDDALEECLSQGYTVLQGKKASGGSFIDVNPQGDPIVIGYKVTTDPNNAIRRIVGGYDDDDKPAGYTLVEVSGSICDYFTRLSGFFSEYTYLFYSKSASGKPITELELLDSDRGKEMVRLVPGSKESFNLQAGLNRFYGLNIVRDADASATATTISAESITVNIVISAILLAALIAVVILAVRNKRQNRKATE